MVRVHFVIVVVVVDSSCSFCFLFIVPCGQVSTIDSLVTLKTVMSSVSSAVSSASLLYNIYEYEKDPLLIEQEQNHNVHTTGTVHVVEKDDSDNDNSVSSSNKIIIDQKRVKKIYSIHIDKDSNNKSINQQVVTVVGTTFPSRFVVSSPSSVSSIVNSITTTIYMIYKTIQSIGIQLVLPINYPYSVRSGYIQYQIYDSIQGLCSYLRNIICSAYILEAAGVGNNTSSNSTVSTSAWHAAIIWSIRDGIGLIGSLIYTYMISSYLDTYIKEFRFFADIINDLGFTFDMILPFVVSYNNKKNNTSNNNDSNNSTTTLFWFISSMSVLCKMMCGISAGATKSSITQHFALHGNIADLNAKESTQETIVTLLGMIGGIYIAQILHYYESQSSLSSSIDDENNTNTTTSSNTTNYNNRIITWIFFCILTIIHIYANYCGISLLRLRTINRSRLDLCLHITTTRTSTTKSSTDNKNQNDNPNDISFLTLIDQIKSFDTNNMKNNDMIITSIRPILVSIIRPPNDIHEIMYLYIWQMIGIIPKSYIYTNTISYSKLQPYFIHSSLLGQLILSQHQTFDISSIRYNITLVPITIRTRTMNQKKANRIKYNVAISLFIGATSYDEIQAYIHGKIIVLFMMQQLHLQQESNNNNQTNDTDVQQQQHKQWLLDSYRIVQILFYNMNTATSSTSNSENRSNSNSTTSSSNMIPLLISELQNKDWDVSRFYLGYPSQRYQIILNTADTSSTTTTTTTTRNDTISKKEN